MLPRPLVEVSSAEHPFTLGQSERIDLIQRGRNPVRKKWPPLKPVGVSLLNGLSRRSRVLNPLIEIARVPSQPLNHLLDLNRRIAIPVTIRLLRDYFADIRTPPRNEGIDIRRKEGVEERNAVPVDLHQRVNQLVIGGVHAKRAHGRLEAPKVRGICRLRPSIPFAQVSTTEDLLFAYVQVGRHVLHEAAPP